jgi:hypothetical protein
MRRYAVKNAADFWRITVKVPFTVHIAEDRPRLSAPDAEDRGFRLIFTLCFSCGTAG